LVDPHEVADAGSPFGSIGQAVQDGKEAQVLTHAEPAVQHRFMANESDSPPDGGIRERIVSEDPDPPPARTQRRAEHAEKGRLSRPVGAENREATSGGHHEGHAAEHRLAPVTPPKVFGGNRVPSAGHVRPQRSNRRPTR